MGWFVAAVVWYLGGLAVCITAVLYESAHEDTRTVLVSDILEAAGVYLAISLVGPALVWFIWIASQEEELL